jgi:serine/threonine protein kinase
MTPLSANGEGLLGTVLQDSFRLIRLIGQGGMGTVYEGTQLRLNKRVAVKVLARQLASNEEALARFRREAEVTSSLGHPHIVHVFDFGTAPSGEPYLVMEYLEGEDLDQRIRRAGRLSLASVVNIVKQVASALSSTHSKGIVHRDLKPANIFVLEVEGETDFVKIVDFGISKVRAASVRLTGASALVGTPNYMSPEQAAGQVDEIDHKTDQWSLACIAYETLAGRGPFVGDTVHSLLYQVIHQEPPRLTAIVPGLPEEVENVIRRALSKRQADRFPTVNAFSRALAAASTAVPVGVVSEHEASTKTATLPPLPAPPSASPRPPPTTLSRTASELMISLSRLRARLTSKWGAAAVAGVSLVSLSGILIFRTGSTPAKKAPATVAISPSSPPPGPPVIIAPMPVPTMAPPLPVAATTTLARIDALPKTDKSSPRPSPTKKPKPATDADLAVHEEQTHKAKSVKADATGAAPSPTIGHSPSKTLPTSPTPKRHLIEEL